MSLTIIEKNTSHGPVAVATITNASGASVVLSGIGAGILNIHVPDKAGKLRDVVLGYDDIESYFGDGPCMGKTPGRYANRIARGLFKLDGKQYRLDCNCGPNHLHGGNGGFHNQIWDAERVSDNAVRFSLFSPDGQEGYPGNVKVSATYTWDDANELTIDYEASADSPTPLNLTNHTYFNLHGTENGSGLDHILRVAASRRLATNDSLAPTGEMPAVEGTPMDFTASKRVGRDIRADFGPLRVGKGYDHCWVLDRPGLDSVAARLESPVSGIAVEISTDQPGVQVYTGNWLTGSPLGKEGRELHDYDAVAIECQGLPDAPNQPNFPDQIVRPGETYRRTIKFKFIIMSIKPTLFVLAAGMGSRYGGLKQLDGLGPHGETIMDYSIYDALRAGFGKVVFVIRKDFESDFREKILSKYEGHIPVEVVFQGLDKLPEGYSVHPDRVKPWGTNHAVLMGAGVINEPFAVINADDYYGTDAFRVIADELSRPRSGKGDYCMVGFRVANTMTDNGSVSRGICTVLDGKLTDVVERTKIYFNANHDVAFTDENGAEQRLAPETPVSMNFWGFTPDYFEFSEREFRKFLDSNKDPLKGEYFIPSVVNDLIHSGEASVKVLDTTSTWFGVTYPGDRPSVVEKFAQLHKSGVYPDKLF